jgi:hypothetical protein
MNGCVEDQFVVGYQKFADRPVYTFETGGSTGVPKSRINIEDFAQTTKRSATL